VGVGEFAITRTQHRTSEEDHVRVTEFLAQSNDWDHMNGWGGGWMWLWGVAMMAGFVALVVWIARANSGASGASTPPPRDPTDRAKEILAERFAKGELSSDDYRERVNELK
jgi:putative membrane protein